MKLFWFLFFSWCPSLNLNISLLRTSDCFMYEDKPCIHKKFIIVSNSDEECVRCTFEMVFDGHEIKSGHILFYVDMALNATELLRAFIERLDVLCQMVPHGTNYNPYTLLWSNVIVRQYILILGVQQNIFGLLIKCFLLSSFNCLFWPIFSTWSLQRVQQFLIFQPNMTWI